MADETEQFEPVGAPGRRAGAARGGAVLHDLPDHPHLQRLAEFANTNAVLDALAHEQPLWDQLPPAPGLLGGKEARYMEGDARLANWPVCP